MVGSVGIIGYGSFGAFLVELARKDIPKTSVKVFSRSKPIDSKIFFPLEEVCTCDLVILAVPVHVFEETVQNVLPLIGTNTVIVDVATVKKYPIDILEKHAASAYYMTTHPMFGPYSYARKEGHLNGLRIVLCDYQLPEGMYEQVKAWLTSIGLVVLELSADEHDKMLAETLFLTHLISQSIVEADYRRTEIDTISFGFLMDAVESVRHDLDLFKSVYKYNPYCKKVLEHYNTALSRMGKNLEEQ